MEKRQTDRDGEIFQDDLTENESKPRGSVREDAEERLTLDPGVDSEEADRAMEENRFGINRPSGT